MALLKEKPIYVFRKGKYYNIKKNEIRDNLTKSEKEKFVIMNLPDNKTHLTKYDKNNKYSYKVVKEQVEHGISTNEVDILYLIDYIYLINELEYKNILIRTPYFSIALVNNINVEFIEHLKEEGEDLQFFSTIFNNNEFIHSELSELYDKIVNDKSENNLISIVFFILLALGVYYGVIHEDEEEERTLTETSYIANDRTMQKNKLRIEKNKQYKIVEDKHKEILSLFRQRKFINSLIEYGQEKKVENMFKMITEIKMKKEGGKYSMIIYSLLPDVGFKRKGKMYSKSIKMNEYEEDKDYRNKLNKEIMENTKEFEEFFINDKKIKDFHYITNVKDFLKKNEFEYRLKELTPKLTADEYKYKLKTVNVNDKMTYLKNNFGFQTEEVKEGSVVLSLKRTVEADVAYELLRYFRDMNILVDDLSLQKTKKTINATLFKAKCKIELKTKDK